MPMPNYHSARQHDPDDFKKGAMKDGGDFDTITLTKGVTAIIGKLKKPPSGLSKDATTIQTYRFDKKVFTVKQAKDWLKKHGKKTDSFEAAKKEITEIAIRNAFASSTLSSKPVMYNGHGKKYTETEIRKAFRINEHE